MASGVWRESDEDTAGGTGAQVEALTVTSSSTGFEGTTLVAATDGLDALFSQLNISANGNTGLITRHVMFFKKVFF